MLARMNVSSVQQARFLGTPLVVRTTVARCSAKARPEASVAPKEVTKFAAAGAVAATLLSSGNALAAQEVAQLAANDNRLGALLLLLGPAIGWVLYNIGGPASRQLDDMKRGVIAGVGLGAAGMLAAQNAEAAQMIGTIAENDNRLGAIILLLGPAVGWVLFNIGGPASRQLDDMGGKKKKSIAGALGLGAAGLALAADQANAATQVAQLAANDNRLGALLLLLGPAIGWVLYNIGGPASRQFDDMKKGVVAGLGLGAATMFAAQSAEAAQMIGTIAENDGRLGAIILLLGPAIGWVLYNIGGPASRQLDDMSGK